MEDLIGVYGILDLDHWPKAPFLLLDGGVEKRWKESYAFYNTDRGTYSGWLMQYTLSGTGWFEKNGKTYEMRPGRGFLCQIPENSRYYLHPESEEPWMFLYFHFRGSAVPCMAEQGWVSFAHFTRCFREETGVSPMQYLQEARIRKAMTLLLNTGKSVEEIAAETGFSSGNYFGKVFRHHMGISPSAYRKERQNGAV